MERSVTTVYRNGISISSNIGLFWVNLFKTLYSQPVKMDSYQTSLVKLNSSLFGGLVIVNEKKQFFSPAFLLYISSCQKKKKNGEPKKGL